MSTTTAQSHTEAFAAFVAPLAYSDIPADVTANLKDHILDTSGCLVAGASMDWNQRLHELAKRMGGPPEATLIGDGAKVGVAAAAFGNGALGRALDMDDTHFRNWEHMHAYLVPLALSVGEWLHSSGEELITAIIAGDEVGSRMGMTVGRGKAFMHDPSMGAIENTAVTPTGQLFGSVTTAAKLMGLSEDEIVSAMGFVGSFGLFLRQSHREKAHGTPVNTGWAAHAGVMAAMVAQTGLKGPRQVLEGDRGFFEAIVAPNPYDLSELGKDLGTRWESAQATYKMYPAGHGTHYFLTSLRALMQEGLNPGDVEEIVCRVPQVRIEFHFSPHELVYNPGPYDARFSLPYLLARTLLDGNVGTASFDEDKVRDPAVLDLARRITHVRDEEAWLPENRGHLIVKTKDGRTLERQTPHDQLPGTPRMPIPREDILEKFREIVAMQLNPDETEELLAAFENLEGTADVGEIMRLTVPRGRR